MNEEAYKELLAKTRSWCSRRDRSRQEVHRRLSNAGLDSVRCEEALQLLEEEQYIDDQRFANAFVSGHFRLKHWGRIKIIHALRQLGVGNEHIQKALSEEIDGSEYLVTLHHILTKRAQSDLFHHPAGALKEAERIEGRQKLFRYAQQRGYEPELIHAALDTIIREA